MTPDQTNDPAVIRNSWDDDGFTDVVPAPVVQHDDATDGEGA